MTNLHTPNQGRHWRWPRVRHRWWDEHQLLSSRASAGNRCRCCKRKLCCFLFCSRWRNAFAAGARSEQVSVDTRFPFPSQWWNSEPSWNTGKTTDVQNFVIIKVVFLALLLRNRRKKGKSYRFYVETVEDVFSIVWKLVRNCPQLRLAGTTDCV